MYIRLVHVSGSTTRNAEPMKIRQVLPQVIKGRTMTQERSIPGRSHHETYAATASVGLLMNAVLKRMLERRTCFYGRVRLEIKPRRASSHKHLLSLSRR